MDAEDSGQSGYYQAIARAFLERRGGPVFLSPKDQAAIAGWEAKRIPLRVVLEGIGRTFDALRARGRGTKGISLAFCERQVDEAFAQHRDRAAGRKKVPEAGDHLDKNERVRREIGKALEALSDDDAEMTRLLQAALEALTAAPADGAALERIDGEIEDLLWARATPAERAGAEAVVRKGLKGRKPAGLDDLVRRQIVMTARAGRRIPHASLYYY